LPGVGKLGEGDKLEIKPEVRPKIFKDDAAKLLGLSS
jgi:predicted TIM-barrel fold metal-dependent hydrolase